MFASESMIPFGLATTATYSCDSGYGLMGGDTVRTCEENEGSVIGAWSGMASSCGGKHIWYFIKINMQSLSF